MIPARFAPVLFGLILSGMMTLMVSGLSTFMARGMVPGVLVMWVQAWGASWLIAFPMVLIVAPITRRIVARLVTKA